MSISKRASKQVSQIQNYREFPSWWALAQVALGIAFFLYIGYSFVSQDSGVTPQQLVAAQGEGVAVESTQNEDPSTTPSPQEDATTSLALADGSGEQAVPEKSVKVATDAATGLFTTDFSKVVFAQGATPPQVPAIYDSPQVAKPVIASYSKDLITYNFSVDPDGTGPEALRTISISVQNENNKWGWLVS